MKSSTTSRVGLILSHLLLYDTGQSMTSWKKKTTTRSIVAYQYSYISLISDLPISICRSCGEVPSRKMRHKCMYEQCVSGRYECSSLLESCIESIIYLVFSIYRSCLSSSYRISQRCKKAGRQSAKLPNISCIQDPAFVRLQQGQASQRPHKKASRTIFTLPSQRREKFILAPFHHLPRCFEIVMMNNKKE